MPDLSNSRWVKHHSGEFDAVWVPDCGGAWWDVMQLRDINEDIYLEHLELLLHAVLSLVKAGGMLYLGKLPEDATMFASRLLSMLSPAYLDKVKTVTVLDTRTNSLLTEFVALEKSA